MVGRLAGRFRALGFMALLAAASGAPAPAVAAESDSPSLEHRVKAAFLYKIAGYVEWPGAAFAQPDTPITIGVVGADAIAAELSEVVAGRVLHKRPLEVRRLKPGELPDRLHILFVGRAENALLNQLVAKARERPILIVTETDGALARGSAINFVVADRRVRFEVSLPAAERGGIKLSSRLLAVAQQVHTGAR